MMYRCSLCEYSSNNKHCITKHFNKKIKCGEGMQTVVEIKIELKCDYCSKNISTNAHMIKHLKVCKIKKANLEKELEKEKEEVKILKEKLALEALNKKSNNDEYKIKYEKLNETFDSLIKILDKKVLGNTGVEIIRKESRKKYIENSENMDCVHCKHSGSTQVCHIKAISDFNKLSLVDEINDLSNLIGLCPNCHTDLDKHKKFEVMRTATLHSMLVKSSSNKN